jgi:hypothetical protein
MQFHVPQFIDVEDKIFGPFSARQFFYIGGAIGAFFVFFSITKSFIFGLLLSSPFIALGLALAFYKINKRPFIYILEAAFKYTLQPRLFIWHKEQKKISRKKKAEEDAKGIAEELFVPKLSDSKLKDLAWSLDIQESVYSDENQR